MEIVTIANQKGGCGKTVTAVNLAGALSGLGGRVLFIDLDPQAHATTAFGMDIPDADKSSYALLEAFLSGEAEAGLPTLMHQRYQNLWVVGSHISLSTMEQKLTGIKDAVLALSNALARIGGADFDYVIIDTPPSLGFLTLNAMHAANRIIVPLDVSRFSLNGVAQIEQMLELSSSMGYKKPQVQFIITAFDNRSNFSKSFLQKAKERFKDQLLATVIRPNVKLRESAEAGEIIFEHEPSSNGAKDYLSMAREFMPQLKEEPFNINKFSQKARLSRTFFKIYAPEAKSVYLAGDFNGWSVTDSTLMKKLDNGTWLKVLPLSQGTYHYKFVVDGRWIEDPANELREEDGLGGRNSLISVRLLE